MLRHGDISSQIYTGSQHLVKAFETKNDLGVSIFISVFYPRQKLSLLPYSLIVVEIRLGPTLLLSTVQYEKIHDTMCHTRPTPQASRH